MRKHSNVELPVEITQLPVQQLQEIKQQLDRELEHLTNSFQSLRTAQSKFRDCIKSIKTGVNEDALGTINLLLDVF